MAELSLASLNIERSKHLDLVTPFLKERHPDIVCLQELMDYDIPLFERTIGASCYFSPLTRHAAEGKLGIMGIGIFSRVPIRKREQYYYFGGSDQIVDWDTTDLATKHATESHSVVRVDAQLEEEMFRICTTHFTWTPNGEPDDFQRQDLAAMMDVLEGIGEFVLCGDFNAPRGGEIFSAIASRYKDNIPKRYVTSIDVELHRTKAQGKTHEVANKMVDGLFTTPEYKATAVELVFGVSDHAAIVANIAKV